ncbi:collagen alpha-1(I) chain-like [Canis lupus familiaris]|uniref:collagen alpha-1(I) chain-like n=1 Tax=Canis lupus familiaris TaxID=9615 RepID=UPI0018F4268A|nr:collagen alpha-1(I) chain-like [Canis lupus familiaris]
MGRRRHGGRAIGPRLSRVTKAAGARPPAGAGGRLTGGRSRPTDRGAHTSAAAAARGDKGASPATPSPPDGPDGGGGPRAGDGDARWSRRGRQRAEHALTRAGGGAPGQSPNPSPPPGRRARGADRPTASWPPGTRPTPGARARQGGDAAGGGGGRRETTAAPRHHTTPPPGGGGKRRTRREGRSGSGKRRAPRGARHRVGKTDDGRGRTFGKGRGRETPRRPGASQAPENGKRERWRRGPRATARGFREASEGTWEAEVGRPGAHAGSHRPRPPAQGRSRGTRGRRPGPHGGPQATSRGSGAPTATVHATGSLENALPHTRNDAPPQHPPRASLLPFLGGPRALRPGTPPPRATAAKGGGQDTQQRRGRFRSTEGGVRGAARAAHPRPCGRGTRAGGGAGRRRRGGGAQRARAGRARGKGPVPGRARQRRREPGHRVNAHGIPPPPARGRSRDARDAGRPQHPWQASPQTGPHTARAQARATPAAGGPSEPPSVHPPVRPSVRSNPESRPGQAPPGGSWPDPRAPAEPPPAATRLGSGRRPRQPGQPAARAAHTWGEWRGGGGPPQPPGRAHTRTRTRATHPAPDAGPARRDPPPSRRREAQAAVGRQRAALCPNTSRRESNPASLATLHAQRRGSGWGLRYPKAPSRIAREGFLTEGASPPPVRPPKRAPPGGAPGLTGLAGRGTGLRQGTGTGQPRALAAGAPSRTPPPPRPRTAWSRHRPEERAPRLPRATTAAAARGESPGKETTPPLGLRHLRRPGALQGHHGGPGATRSSTPRPGGEQRGVGPALPAEEGRAARHGPRPSGKAGESVRHVRGPRSRQRREARRREGGVGPESAPPPTPARAPRAPATTAGRGGAGEGGARGQNEKSGRIRRGRPSLV